MTAFECKAISKFSLCCLKKHGDFTKVVFLVGQIVDGEFQDLIKVKDLDGKETFLAHHVDSSFLQEESTRHGDIVQERFIDSYSNLTIKSLMGMKWATQNCDHFSFLLKERKIRGHHLFNGKRITQCTLYL